MALIPESVINDSFHMHDPLPPPNSESDYPLPVRTRQQLQELDEVSVMDLLQRMMANGANLGRDAGAEFLRMLGFSANEGGEGEEGEDEDEAENPEEENGGQ